MAVNGDRFCVVNEEGMLWSNSEGWTQGDDWETYTYEETLYYQIPIGGRWEEY